jgi:hypothetical protein
MTGRSECSSGTVAGVTDCRNGGASSVRACRRFCLVLAVALFVLASAALVGGCSSPKPVQQKSVPDTGPSPADMQRLGAAKAAAATALADVEACESAVMAGASLDELTRKATRARDSVGAFARSENGRLLPKVTAAMTLAEQDYYNSCVVWRRDEEAAAAKAKKARASVKPGSSSAQLLTAAQYKHPNLYEDLWVQGGLDLGKARTALQDATL